MTTNNLADAYRLIRAYMATLTSLTGSYQHRSAAWFRERAALARAVAEECERAAAELDRKTA